MSNKHPRFAEYCFRASSGLPPCPQTDAVIAWLNQHAERLAPVTQPDLHRLKKIILDLGPDSPHAEQFDRVLENMQRDGVDAAIGQYNEARMVYTGKQFQANEGSNEEARTIHLGLDVFMSAGTKIYAPLDGMVHSFADNALPQDYGPTIILEHLIPEQNLAFFTLYGHLSRESLQNVQLSQRIQAGEHIGWIGEKEVNGGWEPHLHLQLMMDMLGQYGNFPGVAPAGKRSVWLSLCPDPNLLMRIPELAG